MQGVGVHKVLERGVGRQGVGNAATKQPRAVQTRTHEAGEVCADHVGGSWPQTMAAGWSNVTSSRPLDQNIGGEDSTSPLGIRGRGAQTLQICRL